MLRKANLLFKILDVREKEEKRRKELEQMRDQAKERRISQLKVCCWLRILPNSSFASALLSVIFSILHV